MARSLYTRENVIDILAMPDDIGSKWTDYIRNVVQQAERSKTWVNRDGALLAALDSEYTPKSSPMDLWYRYHIYLLAFVGVPGSEGVSIATHITKDGQWYKFGVRRDGFDKPDSVQLGTMLSNAWARKVRATLVCVSSFEDRPSKYMYALRASYIAYGLDAMKITFEEIPSVVSTEWYSTGRMRVMIVSTGVNTGIVIDVRLDVSTNRSHVRVSTDTVSAKKDGPFNTVSPQLIDATDQTLDGIKSVIGRVFGTQKTIHKFTQETVVVVIWRMILCCRIVILDDILQSEDPAIGHLPDLLDSGSLPLDFNISDIPLGDIGALDHTIDDQPPRSDAELQENFVDTKRMIESFSDVNIDGAPTSMVPLTLASKFIYKSPVLLDLWFDPEQAANYALIASGDRTIIEHHTADTREPPGRHDDDADEIPVNSEELYDLDAFLYE